MTTVREPRTGDCAEHAVCSSWGGRAQILPMDLGAGKRPRITQSGAQHHAGTTTGRGQTDNREYHL